MSSFVLAVVFIFSLSASGQAGFIKRYQARVSATQASQPRWMTPLITTSPRLEQEWRADFSRQRNSAGYDTWSLGSGRGPETIPFGPVQITLGLPPFVDHTAPHQKDGFGDLSFLMKYRISARNESHGNRIVTAFLGASIPTGKNANGLCCAVVTPTLAAGKGWGGFDVVMTAGGSLPVTDAVDLGHMIVWNTTAQYQLAPAGFRRFLWPEIESNTVFFSGGAHDGETQSFMVPALLIGRLPLSHAAIGAPGRRALAFGVGEQIAITSFHTSNHNVVFTVRLPF